MHVKISRFSMLLTAFIAAGMMHAQEEKKERGDTKGGQAEHHGAPYRERGGQPERVQHDAAPAQDHRQSTPADQQTAPRQNPPPRQHEVPANNNPINRQGDQTFGRYPQATSPAASAPRHEPPAVNRGGPPQPAPHVVTTARGDVIRRNSTGQVTQVHLNNGTTIYHPPLGPRRVEVVRPGGRVVVTLGPGHGYVQRQVIIRNTTIIKRTYIYGGVPQARIYRPVVYRGVTLAVYTPVRYYRPAFYVYVYNPWPRPIVYTWGWGPWYGYSETYFRPYAVYASPSLWLTDYLIASTLEAAYQGRIAAQVNANFNSAQQAPLTPEVKQAIANEVRWQIDQERAEGQNAASVQAGQSIFADNRSQVFVVNEPLTVSSSNGECSIMEGDVLQMNGARAPEASSADLIVLASRSGIARRAAAFPSGCRTCRR